MSLVLALLAGFYVSTVVDSKVSPKEDLEKDYKLHTPITSDVGVLQNSPGGGGDRQERLASALVKILRLPIQRDSEDHHVMKGVASESEISKALVNIMARRVAHETQDHHGREGFMKNMFNIAADEEEVLRKRVAAAFTSLFRLPPEWSKEKSHSYQQVASEKELAKALVNLLAKRGNQQQDLKVGGSLFDRLFKFSGEEDVTMEKVTTALIGTIGMPLKNNKELLTVKSVASEREISKAIVNIIARRRSKRQAVNEDDIRRAICSVSVTPGEFFRLVAGSVNCRDVVACKEDGLRALRCPPGLAFSLQDQACDWKQNVVDCHLKVRDKAHIN